MAEYFELKDRYGSEINVYVSDRATRATPVEVEVEMWDYEGDMVRASLSSEEAAKLRDALTACISEVAEPDADSST